MQTTRAWSAVALVELAAGCVVVAVGAGAGGGIYYTKRGAEAVVSAPIEDAFSATRRAFAYYRIRVTEAELEDEEDEEEEAEEQEAEVKGELRSRDLEVEVKLKAKGREPTRIRVVAKRSEVGWDRDFARALLEKIVEYLR